MLQEFSEDEAVSLPLPFTVRITNSDISIYDDKQRKYKSAVKMPPSQIVIEELFITRDANGVITMKNRIPDEPHNNERNMDNNTDINDTLAAVDVGNNGDTMAYTSTLNGPLISQNITNQVNGLISENGRLLDDLKVFSHFNYYLLDLNEV